jgi:hypothetical protein
MKGQLAVETLMIYGVVLLIVTLVIGALIGFGILDMGGILPEKCEIKGVNIGCTDYLVNPGSNGVSIRLLNSLGENIKLKSIRVYGEGDSEGLWGPACAYTASTSSNPEADIDLPPEFLNAFQLLNGESRTFSLTDCNVKVSSGKRIKGTIAIEYAKAGSDLVRTSYGTINVAVA